MERDTGKVDPSAFLPIDIVQESSAVVEQQSIVIEETEVIQEIVVNRLRLDVDTVPCPPADPSAFLPIDFVQESSAVVEQQSIVIEETEVIEELVEKLNRLRLDVDTVPCPTAVHRKDRGDRRRRDRGEKRGKALREDRSRRVQRDSGKVDPCAFLPIDIVQESSAVVEQQKDRDDGRGRRERVDR